MNRQNDTTVSIILYTSKTLANGEHPLMLRITKDRKRKYQSLKISCPVKLWDATNQTVRKSHPQKRLIDNIIIKQKAKYADQVLQFQNDERDFTPETLMGKVSKPKKKNLTVSAFMDVIIQRLTDAKQIGSARVYKDAKRALAHFTSNSLSFTEMDYSFLTKHENFLRQKDYADTSLSVHFRTLRSVYNKAIQEGIAKQNEYPFKAYKIAKFDTSTRKRAISKDDLKNIEAIDLTAEPALLIAQQYFLFSYYGAGINFIDIANLKWSDLIADRIFYNRSKTGKELNFKLSEQAKKIIEYWRPVTGHNPENYIFPILDKEKHISPVQIDNRIHKVITHVNSDLKKIGQKAHIPIPLTTYVARHTFATVLKKTGAHTAVISEAMGHKSEMITQTYLASFENEVIDTAMENL